MNASFHRPQESRGLRHPQTSAQSPGTAPGAHNGVGPGGIGKSESAKASSIILRLQLPLIINFDTPKKP